jgi:hypothetical protein
MEPTKEACVQKREPGPERVAVIILAFLTAALISYYSWEIIKILSGEHVPTHEFRNW